ncbi:MAG: hypothetical protein AB1796_07190 [Bacillota bacterium]
MEQLKLLWELQELEREIARKENDLQNISSVKAFHALKKEVSDLQEILRGHEEKIDAAKKKLKRSEMNLQNTNAVIAGLNKKLYGGEVHNNRELESMEKKLSLMQVEQSALEDEILSIMEELEKDELESSRLGRQGKEVQEQLQQIKVQAQKDMQSARQELAVLGERRTGIMEQVEGPLLQKYRELSGKMQGQCISLVVGGYCGICNVSLPSAFRARILTPGQLVYCENCGSLLVLGD